MSVLDNVKDMYDVKLKPRMLRTLIREQFPDENHPGRLPPELTKLISLLRTHELLSESFNDSVDKTLKESWKSAVDDWLHAVLSLVSSNMSNKCWTGICLLGVTCQECAVDRLLASFSVWFNSIYSHIQPPAESQFVKVASLNAMSDLFSRLDALPNAKRDGSSLAGKLIQPLLKFLNEDDSEAIWEAAVHLLCTILTSFPASVHRYHDNAEVAIVSKLFSGSCSFKMMKKLAYCLALLPKSKGDDDSWCSMIQKILLLINVHLNDFFDGFEEETKGSEAVRALVSPGKDPPPPLGGYTLLGEALDKATKQLPISTISVLILSCCIMLTSPYPVQVTVPIVPLLALVHRVIMVDGSVPRAALPFMTGMQQEFVCSELPLLHLYSLQLLTAIIEGTRSQLLPHAAYIVRLVKQYFKRCTLPELRIKLYSVTKSMVISMGVGMALYLGQEVADNAYADLNPVDDDSSFTVSIPNLKAASYAVMQSSSRKRKHGITESFEQQNDKIGFEVEALKNRQQSPIGLKIAALEAIEVLLNVGGGLRSESWRPTLDFLLISLATNCCKEGWGNEKSTSSPNGPTFTLADLQLSALSALLASLLSPSRGRPLYLAQALELFRRGKQAGTKVAGFCAHALLALEVLVHPRGLPMERVPTSNYNSFDKVKNRFPENVYVGGQKHNTQGPPDSDDDDDLYVKWVSSDTGNLSAAGSSGTKISEQSKEDEVMVESHQLQESIGQFQEHVTGDVKDPELGTERNVADRSSDDKDHEVASTKNLLTDKQDGLANRVENFAGASSSDKGKSSVFDLDDDSSMDSFPDIVTGDPDSDVGEL
ncbi:proline-, glutamic acid- and leucine-rich protein 1-like isoform X3 [Mangifera indica]|uniref:proline-, glutamic acid- and leucine-rich protein 1-like isoform X3 n=1 Tax=Mangifera indica TaxID=29780 RepID=UPI001CFAD397|nr:proline-, glutamic acid- and leucine-rich protein 1-like isoform X3 [Mangifera indica]